MPGSILLPFVIYLNNPTENGQQLENNAQSNQSLAKADQVIAFTFNVSRRCTWRTSETEALPLWSTNGSSTPIDSPDHVLGT